MAGVLYGSGCSGNVLTDLSSAFVVFHKLGSSETTSSYSYTGFPIMPGPVVTLGGSTLVPDVDYSLEYADNVERGTATCWIVGKGSYSGRASATFSIVRSLADATIVVSPLSYTYDGTEKVPQNVYVVYHDGSNLVEGEDYTVSYSGSVNAGLGTVTVTGIGEFSGTSKTAQFIIARRTIAMATCVLQYTDAYQTYNGSAFEPTVTVTDLGRTLVSGTDYEVEYSNNVNPGLATVTVKGLGNYNASTTLTFKIKGNLDSQFASVVFPSDISSVVYTGSPITPQVSVSFASSITLPASAYTVAYSNNVNAGTSGSENPPTVTVSAVEGDSTYYYGSFSATFSITRKTITSASIEFPRSVYPYLAQPVTPSFSVHVGNHALVDGTDYTKTWSNNNGAGSGSVTISGTGNYTGDATGTFVIVNPKFADAIVTLASGPFVFTGSAVEPAVTSVDLYGDTLVEGTHYSVSYSNNVNAGGSAVCRISPIQSSSYSSAGSVDKTFSISPKSLAGSVVAAIGGPFVYSGAPFTPSASVVLSGTVLTGSDYTLSWEFNVEVSESAIVKASGKGNYTGVAIGTFVISPKDLSSFAVKLPYDKYLFTGSAIVPDRVQVSNVVGGEVVTIPETDYDLSYSDNVSIGTATVTATGKNNCSGVSSATFPIVERDISNCLVNFDGNVTEYVYNGTSVTPAYSVHGGSFQLALGTDFSVEWMNNDRVGESACLKVVGNTSTSNGHMAITGFAYVFFRITPMPISVSNVRIDFLDSTDTASFNSANGTSKDSYALVNDLEETFNLLGGIASIAPNGYYYFWKGGDQVCPCVSGRLVGIDNSGSTFAYGVDYDVTYEYNTAVGEGTVKIVARNNDQSVSNPLPNRYSGYASFTFHIRKDFGSVAVPPLESVVYDASRRDLHDLILESGMGFDGVGLRIGWDREQPNGTDMLLIGSSDEVPVSTASDAKKITYGRAMYLTGAADAGVYATYLYPWMGVDAVYDSVQQDGDPIEKTAPAMFVPESVGTGYSDVRINSYFGFLFNANFCNRKQISVVVVPADITRCGLSDSSVIKIGAPFELTDSVTSFSPGVDLSGTKSGDYTMSYRRNSYPGEAEAVATANDEIANLYGTRTEVFHIYIHEMFLKCFADEVSFTGYPIKPGVECTYQPVELVEGSDYEIVYSDNTNVGEAFATVTGWPFAEAKRKSFSITENFLSNPKKYDVHRLVDGEESVTHVVGDNPFLDIVLGSLCFKSDGITEHCPATVVKYDGMDLIPWSHYYLAYSNTKDPGIGYVNVIGKGGFSGTAKRSVRILPSDFSDTDIGGHYGSDTDHPYSVVSDAANPFTTPKEIVDQVLTGSAVTPEIIVRFVGTDLVRDADYSVAFSDNVAIGTATVTITGIGVYAGSTPIVKTFKIVGDLSTGFFSASVSVNGTAVTGSQTPVESFDYSGSRQEPVVSVTFSYGGSTVGLVEGTDYVVKTSGTRGPGTAACTITGIGNYRGSVTRTWIVNGGFGLVRQDMSAYVRSDGIEPIAYLATKTSNPTPVMYYDGRALKSSNVSYSSPDAVLPGSYSVTVTGVSPFSGSVSVPFVVRVSFDDAVIVDRLPFHYLEVDDIPDQTWTGSYVEPTVRVTFNPAPEDSESEETEVPPSAYSVSYSNNIGVGTAYLRITMTGDVYVGTVVRSFKIVSPT